MEQFKRAKVVMLSTNKFSRRNELVIDNSKLLGIHLPQNPEPSLCYSQHLYIISDNEIKEGDWFIHYSHKITTLLKAIDVKDRIFDNQGTSCCKSYCKKIISSTDISLNLPQPSQQFIEKYIEEYNKGNIITDVLVEYETNYKWSTSKELIERSMPELGYREVGNGFIEDVLKLKVNPKNNTITIKKLKESWSREEVIQLLTKLNHTLDIGSNRTFEEWIEENL